MLNPVPVLYHAVAIDPPNWIAPFTVSPATLSAHLDAVTSSGRQPLTVSGYAHGLCGKSVHIISRRRGALAYGWRQCHRIQHGLRGSRPTG